MFLTLSKMLAFGIVLCAVAMAQAADDKIYRSYESSDALPIYTDRPLNRSSKVIASFDRNIAQPRLQARRSAAAVTQLAVRRDTVEPMVQHAARTHGVHPALVKAVIEVESGFNTKALSPKGAVGLMQVMPATAARYGKFNLYSPEQNIDVGTRYLRDLLTMFGGNVRLSVAAYNAGENAVIRNGRQVPPYPETQKYVPMVLERYRYYLPSRQYNGY